MSKDIPITYANGDTLSQCASFHDMSYPPSALVFVRRLSDERLRVLVPTFPCGLRCDIETKTVYYSLDSKVCCSGHAERVAWMSSKMIG